MRKSPAMEIFLNKKEVPSGKIIVKYFCSCNYPAGGTLSKSLKGRYKGGARGSHGYKKIVNGQHGHSLTRTGNISG
jgi:hypothetical protein